MKSWIDQLGWSFLATWRHQTDWLYTLIQYYKVGGFWKADLALRAFYFFNSPYRISKEFLRRRGEGDVYTFGQTPLAALGKIAKECGIHDKDCVYDLGCGTGQTTFWFGLVCGCRVVGIDYLPIFISRARRVLQRLSLPQGRISFEERDFLEVDYHEASVVYLYGTCLDDAVIERLAQQLATLPLGGKVITVSYPITDYQRLGWFSLVTTFPVTFTWGKADVYLQVRTAVGR